MSTKPSAIYTVEFLQAAVKQLAAVDPVHQRRIAKRIDALATEPRPVGAEKLKGSDYLRIRIGDYRVIYQVEDGRLVVLIVELGHRREIYR
ncbi:type II toxin-antitoxin system RelE/ParE family toxin [Corallococcus interemptor]|uniref:type II toxin-antitoxin system RelE family toxin n=1 Tax=Corallococcus TaxID=83461 RepID=UPI001CC025A0|nr:MULTISPECIES: type II toxin-antitoxin system RelE/ParE family toxin [unclassified Corallococcus]MBZ4330856.1 type II toxin-antitoxin system RelE/ParE family toxin [Corallococcus sp. AS-1-12]MBZ4377361.1 type II toxin-antitoxin system RelE/ParE family toxin [Corallococcus sp. AS-1-6]